MVVLLVWKIPFCVLRSKDTAVSGREKCRRRCRNGEQLDWAIEGACLARWAERYGRDGRDSTFIFCTSVKNSWAPPVMCCREDCFITGWKHDAEIQWGYLKRHKNVKQLQRWKTGDMEGQVNKKKNQPSASLVPCIWTFVLKWRSLGKCYRSVWKSKKKARNINAIIIAILKRWNIDHEGFHITWYWLVCII